MEIHYNVCVTGGSGYIGSWLVKKLLEKGHTVHATLRNLEDTAKVGLLKSLPNADTRLLLFQADLHKPDEFEKAIRGCQFVFHVATPMLDVTQRSQYKDSVESVDVSGVRSIADSCIKLQTVKRLIYTASVTASSPLKEDGSGFGSSMNESCWTPLNLLSTSGNDFMTGYAKSKTEAEKEVLSYNEIENGSRLEIVTLACGLVAGDTLLSYIPFSINATISQLTGNHFFKQFLRVLQEFAGSIPLLHIDDVCEAHIFCMERPSLRGRFICVATDPTIQEITNYYQQNYPEFKISQESMGGPERGSRCDFTKLVKEGFEYKYDMKKILDDSVECGRRLGVLEPSASTENQLVTSA
ncbi:NADPH HC-toxin reductase 1-like [Cornus florida]|uniref:NADPH HC-toxin reductase 1-like n=1 Tax=Cornus florida TaxID=4283 RepID=UPI00289C891D|nr:NADPH HC-toxin reductase 1-like [Cornus florida]